MDVKPFIKSFHVASILDPVTSTITVFSSGSNLNFVTMITYKSIPNDLAEEIPTKLSSLNHFPST